MDVYIFACAMLKKTRITHAHKAQPYAHAYTSVHNTHAHKFIDQIYKIF